MFKRACVIQNFPTDQELQNDFVLQPYFMGSVLFLNLCLSCVAAASLAAAIRSDKAEGLSTGLLLEGSSMPLFLQYTDKPCSNFLKSQYTFSSKEFGIKSI